MAGGPEESLRHPSHTGLIVLSLHVGEACNVGPGYERFIYGNLKGELMKPEFLLFF